MLPLKFSNNWGYLEVAILVSNEEQQHLCVHIILYSHIKYVCTCVCMEMGPRDEATHFMYIIGNCE